AGIVSSGYSGEASHVHLLVNFPPAVAISRLASNLIGGVPPAGCDRNSPDRPGTTGGGTAVARVIRRRPGPAGLPSRSCASTSSSRTAPRDGLTSVRLHHRPEGRRTGGQPSSVCEGSMCHQLSPSP